MTNNYKKIISLLITILLLGFSIDWLLNSKDGKDEPIITLVGLIFTLLFQLLDFFPWGHWSRLSQKPNEEPQVYGGLFDFYIEKCSIQIIPVREKNQDKTWLIGIKLSEDGNHNNLRTYDDATYLFTVQQTDNQIACAIHEGQIRSKRDDALTTNYNFERLTLKIERKNKEIHFHLFIRVTLFGRLPLIADNILLRSYKVPEKYHYASILSQGAPKKNYELKFDLPENGMNN